MKCLSVMQPWAWALVNGVKDVENRDWDHGVNYRGPLLIHAGKREQVMATPLILEHEGVRVKWANFSCGRDRGAVVGAVRLVDVVRDSRSEWAMPGCLHLVVQDAFVFERGYPFSGRLGFFDVPIDEAFKATIGNAGAFVEWLAPAELGGIHELHL